MTLITSTHPETTKNECVYSKRFSVSHFYHSICDPQSLQHFYRSLKVNQKPQVTSRVTMNDWITAVIYFALPAHAYARKNPESNRFTMSWIFTFEENNNYNVGMCPPAPGIWDSTEISILTLPVILCS